MKYLEWNNNLGNYFFKPESEGQIITLIISEDDIIQIGLSSGSFAEYTTNEEILESFKSEWRKGYPGLSGNIIEKINQEFNKGLTFYRIGRDSFNCSDIVVKYPPAFMHLVGINAAILEENDPSRYHRIRKYFGVSKTEFPNMHESLNWNDSWNNLIWWSNNFKKGTLGLLPDKSLSSEKFEYMGKPYLFILLSKRQLADFYKCIFEKDVEPKSQISNGELVSAFEQVKGNSDILELITSTNESEEKQTALAILRQLYSIWDGQFEVQGDLVKSFYQSRKLRLCFSINNATGYADFCFRFKEDIYFNSEITFNKERVTINTNKWSVPIEIKNEFESEIFKDDSIGLKAIFRPLEKGVFIFTNGRQEGLHSSVFIEADRIQHSGHQFLLLSNNLIAILHEWLESNGAVDKTEDFLNFRLIEKRFSIFSFNGFKNSYNEIEKLNLPSSKSLRFGSGLKGNSPGEWISGFPISVTLTGAKGNERLLLRSKDDIYESQLIDGQLFKIPKDVNPGSYQIEIVNDEDSTFLPNSGKIVFSELEFPLLSDEILKIYQLNKENDQQDVHSYNSAHNVLNNVSGNYPPPPQFEIWKKERICIDEFETKLAAPLILIEYLSYKGGMSKSEIGQVSAAIFENYSNHEEGSGDVYKLNSYTINALRESCRVETIVNKDGLVTKVDPVKPFIFRLGNYQNFSFSKLNTGTQPFIGALYALGGVYSFDIIQQLNTICKENDAHVNIYEESSLNALIPPSIFIYEKSGGVAIKAILNMLGQIEAYPFYNFIQPMASVFEKQKAYIHLTQLDLHIESRYQCFNAITLKFEKNVINTQRNFPSLSLYEINPWEKYFILRFAQDDLQYNVSVDPRWGKYILLYLKSIENLFYFDSDKNMLAIPSLLRLPVEFEQNLFFFTGRLPAIYWLIESDDEMTYVQEFSKQGRSYLIYKGILKSTAERIANKLGQKLNLKAIKTHD
jgi:hypothetical protein